MNIDEFILKFKSQLEDVNVNVTSETDYVKSEFWDSLTNMVIVVLIEDDYNVKLDAEKLNSFSSVQELYIYVENLK